MSNKEWWRGCVIYQIYPRSFMDVDGNGIGDLRGVAERLDHIAALGADAIWLSPFFKSPMKDFGYDVSDYRDVDPIFGTLEDFRHVLVRAHDLGLKVLIDQVWSHSSDQHEWFKESRKSCDNPKHDWYVWADPKPDGTAPNNWLSYFGGPAWTWDAGRQQYYLHHFLPSQPAINQWNPKVREEIKDIAAYWLDMGVDGFRLDVAHGFLYDPEKRDNPPRDISKSPPSDVPLSNPMSRQERIYSMNIPQNLNWIEEIRTFVNRWDDKCLLAEAGGDDSERVAATYVQTQGRFHLAYSFGLVGSNMTHADIFTAVTKVENLIEDGWMCWSVSNHDFKRVASRLIGTAALRDKALFATTLGLCLRGSYCLYQGEELGLPQADLEFEDLVDPYDIMLYPEHVGRDGCRTPMPWSSEGNHAGFSTAPKTWLPIPSPHKGLAVDVQTKDEDSVLNKFKRFLAWRKENPALVTGGFDMLPTEDPVFAFRRYSEAEENELYCFFNCSSHRQEIELGNKIDPLCFVESQSNHSYIEDGKLKLRAFGYAFFVAHK